MMKRMMAMAAMLLVGAAPAERVVRMDDPVATVRINGQPVRLRVDPAAPGMPLLHRDVAQALGFRMDRKWGISFGFAVGPVPVNVQTTVTRVDHGAGGRKQRIGWATRPFAPVAQGSIGPGGLPEPVVRYVLHPARPGERTVTLPMLRPGFPENLFGDGWMPAIAQIDLDGEPLKLRFKPFHPRTLATAGAAARIARLHGGTLSGATMPTEIAFGVERPVRTMTLAKPLAIGALTLTSLGVRTADNGNTDSIRDGDATAPAGDPDEILVTATGKKRDLKRDTLSLGADALARCSSIVFDTPARAIRLTCG